MATAANTESDSWSTSLTGWWQSAKEKSSNALEFMKRDLTEFSQVLQHDAATAVSSTAAVLKEKLKVDQEDSVAGQARKGLNKLVHSVSGAFYPTKESDENEEVLVIQNSLPIKLDQWQAEMHRIKTENSTFCHEPEGPPELYEAWLESFKVEEHSDEISNIMVNYPETRQIYTKLVPKAISNIEFWQRYFYRVHQLKLSEIRRADLVSRAEDEYQELSWEEESNQDTNQTLPSTVLPVIGASDIVKVDAKNDSDDGGMVKLDYNERLSSTESSDKEGTTGDEWEKDFETEIKDIIQNEKGANKEENWENWE